jgi:hypothetical protein
MRTIPGRPSPAARLARALGLDGNPLRRASDRAEAWIRVGVLVVFLAAGPPAAIGAGHWAYHAEITAARVQAARAGTAAPLHSLTGTAGLAKGGGQAWMRARREEAGDSPRPAEVLAAVMTLVLVALALLATLGLTLGFLSRRRLAAWEAAWSRSGRRGLGASLDLLWATGHSARQCRERCHRLLIPGRVGWTGEKQSS